MLLKPQLNSSHGGSSVGSPGQAAGRGNQQREPNKQGDFSRASSQALNANPGVSSSSSTYSQTNHGHQR